MTRVLDFNCDLGEGCGNDAAILPWISSASLACGLHAGDPSTIRAALRACAAAGVAIGAHPSFADRAGFGRRELACTPADVHALILYQLGAVQALAHADGLRLQHVKPHGALYNLSARDPAIADAIAAAVRCIDPRLRVFGLAGSAAIAAAQRHGLAIAHEVFAERRYEADGTLTPRAHADAVIDDIDASIAQVLTMVREGVVIARTGERVAIRADTLCLHGDRADAAAFAQRLHAALRAEGIEIKAPALADTNPESRTTNPGAP